MRERSRDELLGFSRQLGLTGVTKLAKDVLAVKIAAALEAAHGDGHGEGQGHGAGNGADTGTDSPTGSLSAKFNLGPGVDGKIQDDDPLPASIPWGYGLDRVTAMVVDPQRLYVYWEVTDGAIEAARKQLGPGGAGAWLNLRVYDITGRLFDGTNAHSYFDEGVGRDVRQWFFQIGKPTSTACVEIGLKSQEGFFARIGRSGRVDFPRDAPQGAGPIEWLAVRTATGPAGAPMLGGAPMPDRPPGGPGGSAADGWQGWTDDAGFPAPGGGALIVESSAEWSEGSDESFQGEVGRTEWIGPVHRSEWQSGPFEYPVDAPLGETLERHESGEVTMRSEDGLVHVVYGPWQVVIRGMGARAERQVLATWEYRRTIEMAGGVERFTTEGGAVDGTPGQIGQTGKWVSVGPGSSEWRYVYAGASDRRWVGASERRWMGASELLARGGSEVWIMGASERLLRGASERLYKGSSELLYKGASERLHKGASERRLGGASERQIAGGDVRQLGGGEGVSGGGGPVPSGGPSPYPRPEG